MRQRRLNFTSCILWITAPLLQNTTTVRCFAPVATTSLSYLHVTPTPFSNQPLEEDDDNRRRLPLPLDSPIEDDRKPMRRHSSSISDSSYFNDWSVERYDRPEPIFPDTVKKVVHGAWEAIAGTIYGKQRLDPNVASNAMSRSIYSHRPVRTQQDAGRMGVEIDGAEYLFPIHSESRASAIRHVALCLASKLSSGNWEGFEEDEKSDSRPIAVYFNTIKQALIASQELKLLQHRASNERDNYNNIHIFSLSNNDDIPEKMCRKKRLYGGLGKGEVDPKRGLILIVQPTDYNSEFRPPGPAVGAVSHLQQIVARASVEALPAVILSPRFLAHDHYAGTGWDQSGYRQSETYGGDEPPKGPTPWVMRDFSPPVFAWIGNALEIAPHRQEKENSHASRVVLSQSTMQEGHAWHIFAANEPGLHVDSATTYEYLASTKTSSGRPPKKIMRHILNEWT